MENINKNQLRMTWVHPLVTPIIKQVVEYEPDQGESELSLGHGQPIPELDS